MARILVSGHVNVETTLRVDGFPIEYSPVLYPFHGISSTAAGVGLNLAKALRTLGHEVRLLSLIGADLAGAQMRAAVRAAGIDDHLSVQLHETAQAVILYDRSGRRQIYTDLKDVQEQALQPDAAAAAMEGVDLCVLCNINYARPLLAMARQRGLPVATDVHAVSSLDDEYNGEFMAAADLLFMSDANLPLPPADWAEAVLARFGPEVLVIGMGDAGALLATGEPAQIVTVPSVSLRPVVSTVGAGDALAAAFVHGMVTLGDPLAALRQAVVFAAHKIGEVSAAAGFLSADELAEAVQRTGGGPSAESDGITRQPQG